MSKAENIVENLPSNKQIEKGMEAAKKEIHAVRTAPGIDATGHQILSDTEQVLSSAERLLREKNEGDKLQELIREGQKASLELQHQAEALKQAGAPTVDTEGLRDLAEKTLETARLAGIELVSSNSFRRSLMDFLLLCYDIIADTAIETGVAGESVRRKPLPAKKRGGRKKKAVTTTTTTTTTTVAPGVTTAPPSLATPSRVAAPAPAPAPAPTPSTLAETATPTGKPAEPESLKDQAKEGLEGAINKGLEAAGTRQRVHLSKEQVNSLVDRFVALMKHISQRERTRDVFLGLMDMFSLFGKQITHAKTSLSGETMKTKMESSAEALRYNKHVMKTLSLSREILEQFTGEKSLDGLMFHLRKIDKSIRKDEETRQYFQDLRDYVVDVLNHPELFDDAATGRKGRQLIKRGRKLNDRKLWTHVRGVLDESKTIVNNIQNDPATRKLRDDMKRLIQDLMLDEQGNVVLKENVLEQLRIIIVSSLIERMRIPIPTLHMDDKDMEYTVRNLVVAIRDLVPEKVVLENRGRLAMDFSDVRQPELEVASNTIRLVLENINIHMEQADIAFHRKTFPKVKDRGMLRMDIGGRGMDLVIQLNAYTRSKDLFRVEFVDCDVHNLSFYLQDTRHDWLYNSVLKLMSGRIKRGMETAIENTLINHLEQLNRMLVKQLRKTKGIAQGNKGSIKGNLASMLKSGKDVLSYGGTILPTEEK